MKKGDGIVINLVLNILSSHEFKSQVMALFSWNLLCVGWDHTYKQSRQSIILRACLGWKAIVNALFLRKFYCMLILVPFCSHISLHEGYTIFMVLLYFWRVANICLSQWFLRVILSIFESTRWWMHNIVVRSMKRHNYMFFLKYRLYNNLAK